MSLTIPDDQKQQMLEMLAYQSWLNRGCPVGSPEVDWYQAINIVNTQLTLVGGEQSPSDGYLHQRSNQHSTYDELGNDEDTPADSASLSPFAAQSPGSESKRVKRERKRE